MSALVSGKAFLGLIHTVKQDHGEHTLRQAVDASSDSCRTVLDRQITVLGWYPYAAFDGFIQAIVATLGGHDRDTCLNLGRKGALRDFDTVLKTFSQQASPERLLRYSSVIWSGHFRNAGTMETESTDPNNTVFHIHFAEMVRNHCAIMEGWMLGAFDAFDLEVLAHEETGCMRHGHASHEYHYTWRTK